MPWRPPESSQPEKGEKEKMGEKEKKIISMVKPLHAMETTGFITA
jgi:hypothetical protein